MGTADAKNSSLVSSVISCILSLVIFATMRFYAEWFTASQLNIILGGFVGSWLFLFSLTSVSNVEMIIFGSDFQAKFIPEILFCLTLSCIASGVVHRVCATTCIIFSIVALYFINRISTKYHNKNMAAVEPVQFRKASGKKNK